MAFPGTYNFNYYRGDTFEFIIRPKDAAGNAFSLTGFEPAMTIANRRGFDDPLISTDDVTAFLGDTFKDTTGGIVCTILPTIGRQLTPGTAWQYDVEINSGAETFTLLTGTITVTDDITGANPQNNIVLPTGPTGPTGSTGPVGDS
jgi:hypothetical protein